MNKIKKLFGGLDLTWKKLIIFAILIGIYTGIVAMIPALDYTSFENIAVFFECWILFGTIIIMNSKSNKDSALKCFIFFLISQPIVYLVQVPWSPLKWQILTYYKGWFIWTLLTIPMGFIGYYLKNDKWWGLFILVPVMLFLGCHYMGYVSTLVGTFPYQLLSSLFCAALIILFPLCIFNDKKVKKIGLIIGILIVIGFTILGVVYKKEFYSPILFTSGGSQEIVFNGDFKVKLKDPKYGIVYIKYIESLQDYGVQAEFKKPGETELIMESPEGEIYTFKLTFKKNTYSIERIENESGQ